jgi:hypothetical protein
MTDTRIMPGIVNMEGRTVNSLKVGKMVARHPRPMYETNCGRCGSSSTASQDKLTSGAARCHASMCGKAERVRLDTLREERERIAHHEAEQAAADLEASERRMEAEIGDYEKPLGILESKIARERQKIEEAERVKAEEKAASKRETSEIAKRERQDAQRQYWAEAIQSGPDPRLYVTPELSTAEMPTKEAAARNEAQANKFVQTTPEFAEYKSPANADKIFAYLETNGVFIFDVETLRAAFVRLRDLGVIQKNPKNLKQPVERPTSANLTVAPAKAETKLKPAMFFGWDENGDPHEYTEREVARWSSEEMKRRLRLTAASGALSLPNVGPGPAGSR